MLAQMSLERAHVNLEIARNFNFFQIINFFVFHGKIVKIFDFVENIMISLLLEWHLVARNYGLFLKACQTKMVVFFTGLLNGHFFFTYKPTPTGSGLKKKLSHVKSFLLYVKHFDKLSNEISKWFIGTNLNLDKFLFGMVMHVFCNI